VEESVRSVRLQLLRCRTCAALLAGNRSADAYLSMHFRLQANLAAVQQTTGEQAHVPTRISL
jgi:hypothetical protein